MQNRWNPEEARRYQHSPLALRAYSSRLLGQEEDLVLHGGGNTSVKATRRNVFGQEEDVLYVKGSGWDLRSIEEAGFAPCRLDYLRRLAELETLSDAEMMRQLRLSLLDPAAPTPSVEAILHALIPLRYVDHSHADAVVAISNTPRGESLLAELFGDEVLILPYIMPGFVLARQVHQAARGLDWSRLKGICLLHHGFFTFADSAKESYDNMIALVGRAEDRLREQGCLNAEAAAEYAPRPEDFDALARQRRKASELAGRPMLARWLRDPAAAGFAARADAAAIATRGPLTPDHTIHTKLVPAVLGDDVEEGLQAYAEDYRAYFGRHDPGGLQCLDPAPRAALWEGRGMVCYGANPSRLRTVLDITRHTVRAVQWGEALGGWRALPEAELFAVEYWELEQAKLKKAGASPEFEGRVALVTGAASGIGRACVEEFARAGACVLALDIKPEIADLFDSPAVLGLPCDVRDAEALTGALRRAVERFGGLDLLVGNAGAFPPGMALEAMDDAVWRDCLELNLSANMRLLRAALPFLKLGWEPAVVFIASKNVPAPGPGAAAYSAAKAGLTQLARVAALELGGAGIRVNVLHPNAVFDTGLWNEKVLAERAARYGLSVDEYRRGNVLGVEVSSRDVARAALRLAGRDFARTTGAQLPVDGGNERVI